MVIGNGGSAGAPDLPASTVTCRVPRKKGVEMKTRNLLLVLSPLLLLLATAADAAPVPSEGAFLRSLAAPAAACATALPSLPSQALPHGAQKRTSGGGCNEAYCFSNDDCPCDSNPGFCGVDGVCHYPPPGGGGGGGDLGCPMAHCIFDSSCLANCPAGTHSYCGPGGICVYVP